MVNRLKMWNNKELKKKRIKRACRKKKVKYQGITRPLLIFTDLKYVAFENSGSLPIIDQLGLGC